MEGNTATLRSSASQWSLAGDKQLLDILNNIHQSLVTRCQEVNEKLDEMVSALDGASVDLQNVNNKFMALSNSQFIESRVYDDDVDITTQDPPKEAPKPATPGNDIAQLKQSVATLVAAHETIEILASDSEDEGDEEARMVLKPRDMYAHRPLPYIIGSHAWRTKWHAGLHPEDSDSDSSTSKRDAEDDEYSDSEPEMISQPAPPLEREESTASSELASEQDIVPRAPVSAPGTKPAPADIAAELARRLGGQTVQVPIQEPEYTQPNPVSRKVYRPEQPMPGTIFSDSPPPLPDDEWDTPEDDIFAELRGSRPHNNSGRGQSRAADDLFAGLGGEGQGYLEETQVQQSSTTTAKQKSTLFEDESEPELFDTQPKPALKPESIQEVDNIKKPIGGISLFGNSQGAESIGAAILRRNRLKSSSDEETTEEPSKKPETQAKSQEKNIFDDLFAKSEKEQKRNTKKIDEKKIKEVETPKTKVDLFSDNIFDDIDDIFTTNITKTVKRDKNNQKSLFEDDEDIFSDIAVTKTVDNTKVGSEIMKNKSIFDSDDDLFTDVPKTNKKDTAKEIRKTEESKTNAGLFENQEEDIFTKFDINNDNVIKSNTTEITNNKVLISKNSANDNDNFNDKVNPPSETVETNDNNKKTTKSIFDDDDYDENDDLFSSTATKSSVLSQRNTLITSKTLTLKSKDQKRSLFDDDSDDNDLFGTKIPETSTKSINNNDLSQNDEKTSDASKKSSIFDDLEADIIFAGSKIAVDNKLTNDQSKSIGTPVSKKKSIFDDNDEELFHESNKKTMLDKPKPTLSKKPAMVPRNSKNGAKNLDYNKNVNQTDLKQETGKNTNETLDPKDYTQNSNNVSKTDKLKSETDELLLDVEQDKLNLNKKQIESQLLKETQQVLVTEEHKLYLDEEKVGIPPPVIKRKPEVINPSKIDPKSEGIEPILQDPNAELINQSKIDTKTEEPTLQEPSSVLMNQNKLDTNSKEIETILQEPSPEFFETNEQINDDGIFDDDITNSQTSNDISFHTPNIFDDIFIEPPAFEKSKEPKKSKNVNALFDDDSDDEALFFKKNDPILDEKPDLKPNVSQDALFGIFHDEPPAIDVDFTQKSTKSNTNDITKSDSDNDFFKKQDELEVDFTHESTINDIKDILETDLNDDLFGKKQDELDSSFDSFSEDNTSSVGTKDSKVNDIKPKISDHKPQLDTKPPLKEYTKDTTDEPKRVSKLKTMNFNIDVSTLLPGASPKKKALEPETKSHEDLNKQNKSFEQIDGQTHAKSTENINTTEKIEPIMVKSVSFEGEPESQVLDNKISKERAKIQVKRRPSTRRARKEGLRKSAIDFGDDSTDNSSSIDDLPKKKPNTEQMDPKYDDNNKSKDIYSINYDVNLSKPDDLNDVILQRDSDTGKSNVITTEVDTNKSKEQEITKNNDEVDFNSSMEDKTENAYSIVSETDDIFANITTVNKSTTNLDPEIKQTHDIFENSIKKENQNERITETKVKNIEEKSQEVKFDSPKTVTSKIVYILNDEDIFSNPVETKDSKSRNTDINDDDLFKNVGNTSNVVPSISTLGNVYKDTTRIENKIENVGNKTKKSLFDDLSDEENELFNKNKKSTSKPKRILDSDSEEDLFGKREKDTNTKIVKEKEVKKVRVKSSLFGDEDDDDDLFGTKVKKSIPASSPQPTRSTREVTTKPAELVFDDPLSLLGGDDE